ncbi:MarR family winged helix-turn-helix transcriptional regulator [Pseudolysinimonas sp.]|uniref:MarR family winged helix-turn-helix transcriptional regulator n=1 Tax=Pseudolysinimonas sp. TaxID=2680009 RepID=UPI003F7F5928
MAEPVDDSTAALARALSFAIGRANRRMLAAGEGLGQGHLNALATIFRVGSIRPGDLAQREFVSAPTMTRTLRDLEDRGLVSRTDDPVDGRSILISITPEGEHEVLRRRSARADILAGLIDRLDRSDRQALEAALPALEHLGSVDLDGPI